jgi:hypothetical protein
VLCRLDGEYPFAFIHDTVGQVVREAAGAYTEYIDVLPCFRGHDPEALWVHPSDHHPNETAHQMVADVLAPALLSRLETRDHIDEPPVVWETSNNLGKPTE